MTDDDYTADKIHVIDNSNYVPRIIPTYVALGFLDEYLGRRVLEGGEVVDRFYPNETALVPRFVSILHDIAAEQNITTVIRQEVGRQGHVAVISRELTAYLDGLYGPNPADDSFDLTRLMPRMRTDASGA